MCVALSVNSMKLRVLNRVLLRLSDFWFIEHLRNLFSFLHLPSKFLVDSHVVVAGTVGLSGKWESVVGVTSWACPDGFYEVYVYVGSASLSLNGHPVFYGLTSAGFWLPAFIASYVNQAALNGEIGTPGAGDTALTFINSVGKVGVMSGHGWVLSEGDVLSSAAVFDVRFRRIG